MAKNDFPFEGTTYECELTTVSTMELVGSIHISQAIKKGKKENDVKSPIKQPSKCPPPPPPAITGVPVPQNKRAMPVAFFPSKNVSNFKLDPPQKIGLKFIAGVQGANPTFIGTPPDTNLAVGKSQIILGDNSGLVVFDKKTGKREDVGDAEICSLMNLDGNFTEFLEAGDTRISYDRFSKRYIVIAGTYDFNGNGLNGGLSIAISDTNVISPSTRWTVTNIYNLSIIRDSNILSGRSRHNL